VLFRSMRRHPGEAAGDRGSRFYHLSVRTAADRDAIHRARFIFVSFGSVGAGPPEREAPVFDAGN